MHGLLGASCIWLRWIPQRGESIWWNTGPTRFGRPMCCPVWMFFHHRTRHDDCCNGLLVANRNYDTNRMVSGFTIYVPCSESKCDMSASREFKSPITIAFELFITWSCMSENEIQSKASHLVQYNRPRICNPGSIWAWTRLDLWWI